MKIAEILRHQMQRNHEFSPNCSACEYAEKFVAESAIKPVGGKFLTSVMGMDDSLALDDVREQFARAVKHSPGLSPEKFADQCARLVRYQVLELISVP